MSAQPSASWWQIVQKAFPDENLYRRILAAANREPTDLALLFQDIAQHVLNKQAAIPIQEAQTNNKKRKLENGDTVAAVRTAATSASTIFECKDVSVQIPMRKKMKVDVAVDTSDNAQGVIRLVNPATSEIEVALSNTDIDQVFCLPMPEKQARQSNFVVFPRPGTIDATGRPSEQVLFVMNEAEVAGVVIKEGQAVEGDTYVSVTKRAFERVLQPLGKHVITPDSKQFVSSRPQPHRKGEPAYHVNAYRGSKEGYLFFLENGIIFGFKKPLAFYPFSAIESISYTSVLQRTFNMVIAATEGESGEVKETEFSMLDQEDFAGIDAYVKRHGLNDASMAAQRRAKEYNVNKVKKEEVNGDGEEAINQDDDGRTELEKAEQQLQDEEDELEEDYEVSGGESEGEGESSEEEEEEYGDEEIEGAEEEDGEEE